MWTTTTRQKRSICRSLRAMVELFEMDWNDPGPKGAIYNPPGIRHAMRSGTTPFLALWYLPL